MKGWSNSRYLYLRYYVQFPIPGSDDKIQPKFTPPRVDLQALASAFGLGLAAQFPDAREGTYIFLTD